MKKKKLKVPKRIWVVVAEDDEDPVPNFPLRRVAFLSRKDAIQDSRYHDHYGLVYAVLAYKLETVPKKKVKKKVKK